MSKKTWSVILLGILAVLFIVLCVMGVKMKESLEALEHAEPTDGVIPGAGILTFIYPTMKSTAPHSTASSPTSLRSPETVFRGA